MLGRAKWFALLLGTTGLFWVAPPGTRACSIPVFRYALEHWSPSAYEVMVFSKAEDAGRDRGVLEELTKRPVNVEIRTVDVPPAEMSPADAVIWKSQPHAQLPWVVIRYPESDENAPLVWAGKLEKSTIEGQLMSPARREIARRLLAGQSCVWVLLESGERAKDDRLAAKLDETLKRVAESIKLPEIAPGGPQLRSPLPLNVSFSILRVSRSDPRETALVKMLRVAEPEFADSEDALVIPVVGRGRAISALAPPRVNDQGVGAFAEFICGQCSCEVKELNPGIDLLLAADWDVVFEERQQAPPPVEVVEAGKNVPIAVSDSAMLTETTTTTTTTTTTMTSPGRPVAPPRVIQGPVPGSATREWLIGGIVAAAVTAILSGIMTLRAKRK